jgi:long-chain fatty acid transport protein
VDFAGTIFMPHVKGEVTRPAGQPPFSANADEKVYAIPAIGLSYPLCNAWPFWRLGLAAYGVTGLGADFRSTSLDQPTFYPPVGPIPPPGKPLIASPLTQLQTMKFAPSIAAQPTDRLSFGVAMHIDYSSLDLGEGSQWGYGLGAQVGMIYKLTNNVSLGLNYISPQSISYDNIAHLDMNNPTTRNSLELTSPQQVGMGLSYSTLDNKLLIEGDVKWINWADAAGYQEFDWKNQWVVGVGAQYYLTPQWSVRAGYNFGENPVRTHNNFKGALGTPGSTINVQGNTMPTYYYETFRILGFPAIVEHHLTFGLGYQINQKFSVHAGYMHAFSNSISETGTDIFGTPTTLKATLSEDSVDFGLTWRF